MTGDALPCACRCGCRQRTRIPALTLAIRGAQFARCAQCRSDCETTAEDRSAIDEQEISQWRTDRHALHVQTWRTRVQHRHRDYLDATTTDSQLQPVLEAMAASRTGGAVICGPISVGKTHAAFGLLNDLITMGAATPSSVLFGSEQDVLGAVANAPWAEAEPLRRKLTSARWDIVMIDDVGWGTFKRAEEQHSLWHNLTDSIACRQGRLILTSNHNPSSLEQWIGAPAWERVNLITGRTVVTLNGFNQRARTVALAQGNSTQSR